ncbi:MAG: ATP-binding protein [Bacteroidales bacterium]|jgi:predicted AAA+ superfamily ATPase
MITRTLGNKLIEIGKKYPIVTLTGPRQSGKSTLLKAILPGYRYVSLEDPDIRSFALEDPRGFLSTYPEKIIIDEVQRVPELFSYMQTYVDEKKEEGIYYLAGSQNFLLMESISQSLAGRTAVMKLLPFSHNEMKKAGIVPDIIDKEIFYGGYPRIFDKNIMPTDFYPYYIQTYVEKDLRLLKNIDNLGKFIRFIKLCAGRIGQLLNLSSLANETGIAVSTAQSWISVLETSFIVYLLRPNHKNYSKRLVKSPKLYFYDTGLACSLLDIGDATQISTHFLRGGLFENLVINEFIKFSLNKGVEPQLSFWRDSTGNEVDLIDSGSGRQVAYEIKSGATFTTDYFKGIKVWSELSGTKKSDCHLIYGGDKKFDTSVGTVIPWRDFDLG